MSAARAWTALLLPPLLWYVQQQGLGGPLRVNCHVADGWPALLWGFASLVGCGVAARLAFPAALRSQETGGRVVAWLSRLALLSAALFALAIILGSIASALVPACAR